MRTLPVMALLLVFTSCAMLQVAEDKKPIEQRLYSYDAQVKENAASELAAMNDNLKKGTLVRTASMLCYENDPDTQVRILKALTELNAPPEAVIEVLNCVSRNSELKIDSYLKTFFYSGPMPDKSQLPQTVKYLRSSDWRVTEFALTVIGRMGKEAAPAVPDIIQVMKREDMTPVRFSVCFDAIARISPQAAIDVLVLLMDEKSNIIRQNAVKKLLELDQYMGKGVEAMKEVLPAILRAITSGDEKFKQFIEDAVADIKDPKTQAEIKSYIEATGTMMGGLMRVLGSKVADKLNEQEPRIKQRLKDFYRENHIQDRLKELGIE